ncbi:MAG: hypothetical protein JST51_11715 [Armatimonadetes bacterium]|nr:hypothetical protein [Armatimonadota bacterium]
MEQDQFFHDVETSESKRQFEEGLRKFKGDGQPFIRIQGVQKVHRVFVGTQEVPEFRHDTVLTDPAGTRTSVTEIPLWKYAIGPDGVPILLRSKVSHDGIWQDRADIYIDGDFDDATTVTSGQRAAATRAVTAAEKALADAKTDAERASAQLALDQAKAAKGALG